MGEDRTLDRGLWIIRGWMEPMEFSLEAVQKCKRKWDIFIMRK